MTKEILQRRRVQAMEDYLNAIEQSREVFAKRMNEINQDNLALQKQGEDKKKKK